MGDGAASEKTRDGPEGGVGPVLDLGDTVHTAGAKRICRTAYFCKTREGRDTPKDGPVLSRVTEC
jgi:hypothetical protein